MKCQQMLMETSALVVWDKRWARCISSPLLKCDLVYYKCLHLCLIDSALLTLHLCLYVACQYARVSADTRPDVLYQLLTEQWNLSPPNLLISVTGGAKNFYLKARLKNMFHRGLIKVAQTTGQPATPRGISIINLFYKKAFSS